MAIDVTQFERDYQSIELDWNETLVFDGVTYACQVDQWSKTANAVIGGRANDYELKVHVRVSQMATPANVDDEIVMLGKTFRVMSADISEDAVEYIYTLDRGQ